MSGVNGVMHTPLCHHDITILQRDRGALQACTSNSFVVLSILQCAPCAVIQREDDTAGTIHVRGDGAFRDSR